MKLVKQGDRRHFGKNKVALVHLEFTSLCNQHCSYCIEGNGDPNKDVAQPSHQQTVLQSIHKIFKAFHQDDHIGFILVGGEPTIQPAFLTVVREIQSRKNTNVLLTTNLHRSVRYYDDLDIPIIASLHLDHAEPTLFLQKVMELRHVVAHVRIMAHPQKMDMVRQTYDLFLDVSKQWPINFAVEEVLPFGNYDPNYTSQDLASLGEMQRQRIDCPYSYELEQKLGVLNGIFDKPHWYFEHEGQLIESREGPDNFESFYCERNLLIVRGNGDLLLGYGCGAPGCNLFEITDLPSGIFGAVICTRKVCGRNFGFTLQLPKYVSIRYAPDYVRSRSKVGVRLAIVMLNVRFVAKKVVMPILSWVRNIAPLPIRVRHYLSRWR